MAEASLDAAKKRKSEEPSGHGLLQAAKNKNCLKWQEAAGSHDEFPEGKKKHRSHGENHSFEPTPVHEDGKGDGGEDGSDLISRLHDDILGNIISRLSTKEGARTQILARRWRPLWRSSPLNLQDCGLSGQERRRIVLVNQLLTGHKGAVRRLCLRHISLRKLYARFDRWFNHRALNNLEELDFRYGIDNYEEAPKQPLPPSTLRFASTLVVLSIGHCHFPINGATAESPLHFPLLKRLTLHFVTISEGTFHGVLSVCPSLESLLVSNCVGLRRVCISSKTIRSIGISVCLVGTKFEQDAMLEELIIPDAPCLERLIEFQPCPMTIRVIRAPKLQVLGYLTDHVKQIEKSSTAFSLAQPICTLKVLVLLLSGPNLGTVLQLLKCFPCLKKLYIMMSWKRTDVRNGQQHISSEPIQCIRHHLKEIVIRGFEGHRPDIDFAKFFILNARMLQDMKFGIPKKFGEKWMTNQKKELQLDNKACGDAQFHFTYDNGTDATDYEQRTHDLTISDPFHNFLRI